MHEHLVESALARQILLLVAKMPLAEKARCVAGAPQGFGKCDNPGARRSRCRMVWVTPTSNS
jgi:hypothetical protein